MERKRVLGKLLAIGAGTAVLALAIFVLLPWLTEPQQVAPNEIVAGALNAPAADEGLSSGFEEEVSERPGGAAEVLPVPSSLVGLRDNGEKVAVVFPAAAGDPSEDKTIAVGEGPAGMERDEAPAGPAEGLPPLLSPEEVATAIEGVEGGGEEDTGAVAADQAQRPDAAGELLAEAVESSKSQPSHPDPAAQSEGWQRAVVVGEAEGAPRALAPLPPPSATRDVQELLEALGYGPGPADGIWGERTEKAWRGFARDAAQFAARAAETPESQSEEIAAPSALEFPTPSGEALETEGRRAEQFGDGRRQAGLPPTQPPVIVPDNLRGVMGYRMPLVSRQEVPDQVVSGVLIPAHTTFVVLKPGYWELVGLEPGEVERLREADEDESVPASEVDMQPPKRGWNPLRLFRRQGGHVGTK